MDGPQGVERDVSSPAVSGLREEEGEASRRHEGNCLLERERFSSFFDPNFFRMRVLLNRLQLSPEMPTVGLEELGSPRPNSSTRERRRTVRSCVRQRSSPGTGDSRGKSSYEREENEEEEPEKALCSGIGGGESQGEDDTRERKENKSKEERTREKDNKREEREVSSTSDEGVEKEIPAGQEAEGDDSRDPGEALKQRRSTPSLSVESPTRGSVEIGVADSRSAGKQVGQSPGAGQQACTTDEEDDDDDQEEGAADEVVLAIAEEETKTLR